MAELMQNEYMTVYILPLLWIVVKVLLIIVPLLVAMAYLTYAERKIMAAMHLRQGPMMVGVFGLLQPLADGLKLLGKETIIPNRANKVLFVMAPMLTFMLSLVVWSVVPFGEGLVLADINVGILYLYAVSSLGVYGLVLAGWASNSRYSLIGGMRSA
ncbi:MAG: NADH-quinone oxidoreductase subunit H, partial [Alphaproteobacteria bacterium]|nr:NADH-quinone oxidoreductase subunit H [Alphaproteobacteria bacterium]